jgi:hypothetical protein
MMSVEMALDINATSTSGAGAMTVDVEVTNHGSQPVLGTAAAFGFWLVDANNNYVPGFAASGELSDIAVNIQPNASFSFSFQFTAPSVQVGTIYTLICYFQQTQDESTQTFTFNQVLQPLAV